MEKSNFLGVKTIFEIFENERDKKDDEKEDEFDFFNSSKYRNIEYDSYDYMSIRGHSKSIKMMICMRKKKNISLKWELIYIHL